MHNLTHYIGSHQFWVLLAQQTHTDIARRFLKNLLLFYQTIFHPFVRFLDASRKTNIERHYEATLSKTFLTYITWHFTLCCTNSQCFSQNKNPTLRGQRLNKIILEFTTCNISLARNIYQWFSHRIISRFYLDKVNKTILTYITWQYYIGSQKFSVLFGQRIHTDITRTKVTRNISCVHVLTHFIGSYKFTAILAQQTHTDITRKIFKENIFT